MSRKQSGKKMLTDEHILNHIEEWTDDWVNVHYGSVGFTANMLAALLGEPVERIVDVMLDSGSWLPQYCSETKAFVWRNGHYYHYEEAPRFWDEFGNPIELSELRKSLYAQAKKGPGCINHGNKKREFYRIVKMMRLPVPRGKMTNKTCVHCHVSEDLKRLMNWR